MQYYGELYASLYPLNLQNEGKQVNDDWFTAGV